MSWKWVRWTALVVYAVVLLSWSIEYGVPIGSQYIFGWAFIGLGCACIGRSWRDVGHLFMDWGPLLLVVIVYDLSRGWADDLGMGVHFTPQIDADKLLFFNTVPTEWLQSHLYHTMFVRGFTHGTVVLRPQPMVPVQWWEVVFDLTYLSHYLTSFVLAGFLWVRNRRRFQAYARRFTTLSAFGFLTYALFPAAPPWMAAQQGFLDPSVARLGGRGFAWLHLHSVRNMIDIGAQSSNLVAAVPSLHAGFATLVAITVWPSAPKWLKPFVVAYPLLMGLMLVANAEHYVIDIILGAAYAFAAHFMWNRIETWWTRRQAERSALVGEPGPPEPRAPAGARALQVP